MTSKIILPKPTNLIVPERSIYIPRSKPRMYQRGFMKLMPSLGLWGRQFAALGPDLNGSTDYLERVGTMTGAADDSQFTFSAWIRPDGDPTFGKLISVSFGTLGFYIERKFELGNNFINYELFNSSLNSIAAGFSSNNFVGTGSWHHVMVAVDLVVPTGLIYIDGVNRTSFFDFYGGGSSSVGWGSAQFNRWRIGAGLEGADKFNGAVAELWLSHNTFLNPGVAANMALFRSPQSRPVDLGINGEKPLGSQPLVYCSVRSGGRPQDMQINRGTGEDFGTYAGTPAIANTSPSD
jgi:hypothetical protein